MSIKRELSIHHVRFLAINASNILDEIFLANFLHRACPDVRLVFLAGGDLLLEREAENHPYIGSLTLTRMTWWGCGMFREKGWTREHFPTLARRRCITRRATSSMMMTTGRIRYWLGIRVRIKTP